MKKFDFSALGIDQEATQPTISGRISLQRTEHMYIPGDTKRYFIEFISDLLAVDGYSDIHNDLLHVINHGRHEMSQDIYHLTLKVEVLQMLCRELVREIGAHLCINVREEVEKLNQDIVNRIQASPEKLHPTKAKEILRWLNWNLPE